MKVLLCGEEKAPFPIKAEDAEAALKTEYIQLVSGSKDIEGRDARLPEDLLCLFFAFASHVTASDVKDRSQMSQLGYDAG